MRGKYRNSGLSLVEMLGAVAVITTLATVSVISVKDTVQAGQKSAAQKELQHLNTALQNFRSAGGAVPHDADVDTVVNLLKGGVDLSGSNFTPLSSDPDMTRDIAGVPYTLEYDDEYGFTYEPEFGEGGILGGSGAESAGSTFTFDVNDPVAAQAALAELATLEPGTQEYNDVLAGLNAANMLGTISDGELAAAGLIKQGEQWKDPAEAYAIYAQEAQTLLDGGSGWADLSPVQQEGYANVYPQLAVGLGGASALNLMNEAILTPELVEGFVLDTNTWTAPQVNGSVVNRNNLVTPTQDWYGWSEPFPVVRVTDPLLPAEVVGWVTPYATWYTTTTYPLVQDAEGNWVSGEPYTSEPTPHVYYTFRPNPNVSGVENTGTQTGSNPPPIFSAGMGTPSSQDIVAADAPPSGEYLWSDLSFVALSGGTISVLPTREGIVLPSPTPTPTPSTGGIGISLF
jgi:type II secretory pathway pseudopilin PulG